MTLRSAWKWIDRDLDQPRPISFLLIVVPFIPFGFALEFTDDQATRDAFLLGGLAVAVPWFAYVTWRGLRQVGRSCRQTTTLLRDQPPPLWRWLAGLAVVVVGATLIYTRHFG